MDENNQQDTEIAATSAEQVLNDKGQASSEAEPVRPQQYKNAKERLYDKIPLTVTHLNIIIAVLIVALVAALVIGTLLGNGVI